MEIDRSIDVRRGLLRANRVGGWKIAGYSPRACSGRPFPSPMLEPDCVTKVESYEIGGNRTENRASISQALLGVGVAFSPAAVHARIASRDRLNDGSC